MGLLGLWASIIWQGRLEETFGRRRPPRRAPKEARQPDDQDREGAQKAGRLCESAEGFRMAAIGTAGK
jgi:hypothetical protein